MKRIIPILCCLLLLTGCGEKSEQLDIFAMDTYMNLRATGEGAFDALQESVHVINELEQGMSRTIATSDVAELNALGKSDFGAHSATLLQEALRHAEETGGTFDITVAPLVALWDISGENPRVPAQSEIDALLPLVGSKHLHIDGSTVTIDEGCAIDLGGIAKGYAADMVAEIFHRRGLSGGVANLGGNVYVHGCNDGADWEVAIQDPQNADGYACRVLLRDSFVVTSGGYQRYFTAPDGTVYPHILDPRTGAPADSGLLSVSIVAPYRTDALCGTMADAYSTALYVLGEEAAVSFWQAHRADFEMVLVTEDGRVVYTPGLRDKLKQEEHCGYVYTCVADDAA